MYSRLEPSKILHTWPLEIQESSLRFLKHNRCCVASTRTRLQGYSLGPASNCLRGCLHSGRRSHRRRHRGRSTSKCALQRDDLSPPPFTCSHRSLVNLSKCTTAQTVRPRRLGSLRPPPRTSHSSAPGPFTCTDEIGRSGETTVRGGARRRTYCLDDRVRPQCRAHLEAWCTCTRITCEKVIDTYARATCAREMCASETPTGWISKPADILGDMTLTRQASKLDTPRPGLFLVLAVRLAVCLFQKTPPASQIDASLRCQSLVPIITMSSP